MTPRQRAHYFGRLWPRACEAQGWDPRDADRRRSATLYATGQASSASLDEAGITALFAYLGHLAGDAAASAEWRRCQRLGARAVNSVRQGRWHRDRAGIAEGGRLELGRFATLGDAVAPEMEGPEAEAYLMTMRARARRRARRGAGAGAAGASAARVECPF
jgi:hypothetical protein